MSNACQSAATLGEVLSEAAAFASAAGPLSSELTVTFDALKRALVSDQPPSATLEHEILSLRELARLMRTLSTS
jgi:hypothetical protein